MDPAQRLQLLLTQKFGESVSYEQDDSILYICFEKENVKIKVRAWESDGNLISQIRHSRCQLPNELDILLHKIEEHLKSEIKKRGHYEEDIAKKARSIVPNTISVKRDGNNIGFFVNQSIAIDVAKLLKDYLKKSS